MPHSRLSDSPFRAAVCWGWAVALSLSVAGCGKTQGRSATEQLLASDAVDQAVARIDFRELSGKKVYFDTQFIKNVKAAGFVNAEYIISSLRQQMIAARCLLQENEKDAEIIVEARVGTLGADQHELVYGLPESSMLSTAAEFVPNVPPVPPIPELSVAKRSDQLAASKLSVFAYNRESREPVWQSGIVKSHSTARDVWIFGAGPFQWGTIHDGPRLAGTRLPVPFMKRPQEQPDPTLVPLEDQYTFSKPWQPTQEKPLEEEGEGKVLPAEHTEPAK